MTVLPLVLALALGELAFISQELPGLRAGAPDPLTGAPQVNCRYADLNNDGTRDLVQMGAVRLQRASGGGFSDFVEYPPEVAGLQRDVWGDTLYFAGHQQLRVLRLAGEAWETVAEQPLDWPERSAASGNLGNSALGTPPGLLEQFLHDFDGDGTPELAAPSAAGIHIFTRGNDGVYAARGVLALLPAPQIRPLNDVALWPSESRRLILPPRQTIYRCFLAGAHFSIVQRIEQSDGTAQWRERRYALDPAVGWAAPLGPPEERLSPLVPRYLAPCRLNDNDTLDFAGGEWTLSESTALPRPVYQTAAVLDGGPLLVRRSHVVRPHTHFTDFDGDGDLDLVLEQTGLYEGGVRETLVRFLTRPVVDHTIEVYLQEGGRFATQPAATAHLSLAIEEPPVRDNALFQQYKRGESVDVTGDFDGDGRNDLVVYAGPQELSLYLCEGARFNPAPVKSWKVPRGARFSCVDLNGDGRSDLVVRWLASDAPGQEHTLVHLSMPEPAA